MSSFDYGFWEIVIEKHGRLKLPTALLRALPENEREHCWLTRGEGTHITLWTETAFREKMNFINSLNRNIIMNRNYRNSFLCNMAAVECDAQDRFVIPKRLIDFSKIDKDVILILDNGKIDIWDAAKYNKDFNVSPEEYELLNEKIYSTHQPDSFENF
jgi:MraZ protein